MNSIQMIIHYLLRSRRDFLKFFGLQFFGVILALMIPIYTGYLVGGLKPPLPAETQAILLTNFIIILIFATISFLLGASARTFSAKISARALYYIRKDINEAIYRQSFSYFDKHETGQLVARATSDVDQTEQVFGFGLMLATQGFLQLVGILILAVVIQPSLSWIFAIIIPISVIVSLYITLKLRPIYLESREAFGELTNTIRENIVGATVVRMFGTQEKEKGKFSANNKRFYNASVRTVKWSSIFIPVNTILLGGMIVLTLFFGGNMVIQDHMPLSSLVTYLGYIAMTTFPLISFGSLFIMYVQADAALTRIRQVIESIPEITEDSNPVSAEAIQGNVDFENVSFGYIPSNLVLRNITFHVPAGQKIAILGTTGSGKSTIINLLPRFYDVTEGRILVDGIDIRKYRLKDLRTHIGVVSQETFLFDKSIKENLTFGREESSMEEIVEAAQTADLHSFIASLPEAYDTLTGERGTHLSGGQKQRLSIARALLIRPKILILDDSTSSVDVETEYKIQQALEKVMYHTTTFIITQRISTIRNADQIMVLDKGRIVGLGTHKDLLESNVLYRQIFETLLSKQKKLVAEAVNPIAKERSDP
jgi:ABC-type multidrug transport system fused ATPase/permease subunit